MIDFPASPTNGQVITLGDNKYIWNSTTSQWKNYNVLDSFPSAVTFNGTITAGAIFPSVTNTYDLGTSSLRWRNIYTQDLHLSNGIGDYTVIEGEEDLFLVNNKTGKSFKFMLAEVDPNVVPEKSKTGI